MDITAAEYLKLLRYSVTQQKNELNRMTQLQSSYDNKINRAVWPTQSEIPTAQHFVMVEEKLASVYDSLFPDTNAIQLRPTQNDVTPEQWRNAEWALWTMAQYQVNIKEAAFKSLKDCFKCGVGYTMFDTVMHTPSLSTQVFTKKGNIRILADGTPQRMIRARYISPGRIIPFPEGTDFNGDSPTPMSFMLDFYPQWQLEQMYDGKYGEVQFSVPLQTVLDNAQKLQTSGISELIDFAEKLGGRRRPTNQYDILDVSPISIPIIRVFEQPGIETWISPNGQDQGDIILKIEVEGQQQNVPIVKWDAHPDGDRWYPMSQAEADMNRSYAYDLWLNFLYDMMTRTKDANRVIDKSALPAGQDRIMPGQDIYIGHGNATTAAMYLDPPRIDPALVGVGDILNDIGRRIQGTSDFTQRNYTRGGAGAFQDLLNTMQARERLAVTILETGGVKKCFEQILGLMRRIVPEEGIELSRPEWQPGDSMVLENRIITQDDIVHDYQVVVDTSVRRMLGGMDEQMRLQLAQSLDGRPDTRPEEVARLWPMPENLTRRIFRTREELEAIQAENRAMEIADREAQGTPQPTPQEAEVPPEAAMMMGA